MNTKNNKNNRSLPVSNGMEDKFLKPYNPQESEEQIYKKWEDSGYFNPDKCVEDGVAEKDAEPYCIIMPPPNANGSLHAGHALFVTLQERENSR